MSGLSSWNTLEQQQRQLDRRAACRTPARSHRRGHDVVESQRPARDHPTPGGTGVAWPPRPECGLAQTRHRLGSGRWYDRCARAMAHRTWVFAPPLLQGAGKARALGKGPSDSCSSEVSLRLCFCGGAFVCCFCPYAHRCWGSCPPHGHGSGEAWHRSIVLAGPCVVFGKTMTHVTLWSFPTLRDDSW